MMVLQVPKVAVEQTGESTALSSCRFQDQDSRKNTEKTTAKTRARKTWKLSFPVVDDKII